MVSLCPSPTQDQALEPSKCVRVCVGAGEAAFILLPLPFFLLTVSLLWEAFGQSSNCSPALGTPEQWNLV